MGIPSRVLVLCAFMVGAIVAQEGYMTANTYQTATMSVKPNSGHGPATNAQANDGIIIVPRGHLASKQGHAHKPTEQKHKPAEHKPTSTKKPAEHKPTPTKGATPTKKPVAPHKPSSTHAPHKPVKHPSSTKGTGKHSTPAPTTKHHTPPPAPKEEPKHAEAKPKNGPLKSVSVPGENHVSKKLNSPEAAGRTHGNHSTHSGLQHVASPEAHAKRKLERHKKRQALLEKAHKAKQLEALNKKKAALKKKQELAKKHKKEVALKHKQERLKKKTQEKLAKKKKKERHAKAVRRRIERRTKRQYARFRKRYHKLKVLRDKLAKQLKRLRLQTLKINHEVHNNQTTVRRIKSLRKQARKKYRQAIGTVRLSKRIAAKIQGTTPKLPSNYTKEVNAALTLAAQIQKATKQSWSTVKQNVALAFKAEKGYKEGHQKKLYHEKVAREEKRAKKKKIKEKKAKAEKIQKKARRLKRIEAADKRRKEVAKKALKRAKIHERRQKEKEHKAVVAAAHAKELAKKAQKKAEAKIKVQQAKEKASKAHVQAEKNTKKELAHKHKVQLEKLRKTTERAAKHDKEEKKKNEFHAKERKRKEHRAKKEKKHKAEMFKKDWLKKEKSQKHAAKLQILAEQHAKAVKEHSTKRHKAEKNHKAAIKAKKMEHEKKKKLLEAAKRKKRREKIAKAQSREKLAKHTAQLHKQEVLAKKAAHTKAAARLLERKEKAKQAHAKAIEKHKKHAAKVRAQHKEHEAKKKVIRAKHEARVKAAKKRLEARTKLLAAKKKAHEQLIKKQAKEKRGKVKFALERQRKRVRERKKKHRHALAEKRRKKRLAAAKKRGEVHHKAVEKKHKEHAVKRMKKRVAKEKKKKLLKIQEKKKKERRKREEKKSKENKMKIKIRENKAKAKAKERRLKAFEKEKKHRAAVSYVTKMPISPVKGNEIALGSSLTKSIHHQFTLMFWLKIRHTSKNLTSILTRGAAKGVYRPGIFLAKNSPLVTYRVGNSKFTPQLKLKVGVWNHLAIEQKDKTMVIYLNGFEEARKTFKQTLEGPTAADPLYASSPYYQAAPVRLADVVLHNHAVGGFEVYLRYKKMLWHGRRFMHHHIAKFHPVHGRCFKAKAAKHRALHHKWARCRRLHGIHRRRCFRATRKLLHHHRRLVAKACAAAKTCKGAKARLRRALMNARRYCRTLPHRHRRRVCYRAVKKHAKKWRKGVIYTCTMNLSAGQCSKAKAAYIKAGIKGKTYCRARSTAFARRYCMKHLHKKQRALHVQTARLCRKAKRMKQCRAVSKAYTRDLAFAQHHCKRLLRINARKVCRAKIVPRFALRQLRVKELCDAHPCKRAWAGVKRVKRRAYLHCHSKLTAALTTNVKHKCRAHAKKVVAARVKSAIATCKASKKKKKQRRHKVLNAKQAFRKFQRTLRRAIRKRKARERAARIKKERDEKHEYKQQMQKMNYIARALGLDHSIPRKVKGLCLLRVHGVCVHRGDPIVIHVPSKYPKFHPKRKCIKKVGGNCVKYEHPCFTSMRRYKILKSRGHKLCGAFTNSTKRRLCLRSLTYQGPFHNIALQKCRAYHPHVDPYKRWVMKFIKPNKKLHLMSMQELLDHRLLQLAHVQKLLSDQRAEFLKDKDESHRVIIRARVKELKKLEKMRLRQVADARKPIAAARLKRLKNIKKCVNARRHFNELRSAGLLICAGSKHSKKRAKCEKALHKRDSIFAAAVKAACLPLIKMSKGVTQNLLASNLKKRINRLMRSRQRLSIDRINSNVTATRATLAKKVAALTTKIDKLKRQYTYLLNFAPTKMHREHVVSEFRHMFHKMYNPKNKVVTGWAALWHKHQKKLAAAKQSSTTHHSTTHHSTKHTAKHPPVRKHTTSHHTKHSTTHSTKHSTKHSTTHSTKHSTTHSTKHSTTHSTKHSTTHSTKHSTTHSTKHSTTHSTKHSTTHSAKKSSFLDIEEDLTKQKSHQSTQISDECTGAKKNLEHDSGKLEACDATYSTKPKEKEACKVNYRQRLLNSIKEKHRKCTGAPTGDDPTCKAATVLAEHHIQAETNKCKLEPTPSARAVCSDKAVKFAVKAREWKKCTCKGGKTCKSPFKAKKK